MYMPFEAFPFAGRFISVIGSGGKTTLLRVLSERLPGTVILTTSTHIYPFPGMPLVDTAGSEREAALRQLRAALGEHRVVCLGKGEASGKLSAPCDVLPFEALLSEADHIVAEADGAAGRPLKAHRPWEPVIPGCSDLTLCVVGASGLGQPIAAAAHCPERFAALAGVSIDAQVEERHIAAVLNREALADHYLVNQVDALRDPSRARRLCELIQADASLCALRNAIQGHW